MKPNLERWRAGVRAYLRELGAARPLEPAEWMTITQRVTRHEYLYTFEASDLAGLIATVIETERQELAATTRQHDAQMNHARELLAEQAGEIERLTDQVTELDHALRTG